MSMQDLTSDFVARVNNSIMVENTNISVLKNNMLINVSNKLTKLGFFTSYTVEDRIIKLSVSLGQAHKLKRISKPGRRVYTTYKEMPKFTGGKGFYILSTPKGILTNIECVKEKVGGEMLFSIY
jgi:small subunit ribosomal protein S8